MLADVGADGKVLAGGQSLLPILSMRLAAPGHLVDINRLAELAYVRADADGVRVGALARHAAVERDERAAGVQPLLRQALRLVAHPTIRNRGTTVGSLAHADPSGEMTAVLAVLGGTVDRRLRAGRAGTVAAADFFLGPLESAVARRRARRRGLLPGAAAGRRVRLRRGGPAARRLRGVRRRRRRHADGDAVHGPARLRLDGPDTAGRRARQRGAGRSGAPATGRSAAAGRWRPRARGRHPRDGRLPAAPGAGADRAGAGRAGRRPGAGRRRRSGVR